MVAPAPAAQAASLRDLTEVERIHGLYSYVPTTLAGNAAGASVMALLFWDHAPRWLLAAWMVMFWGLWIFRMWALVAFRGRNVQTLAAAQPWFRIWVGATMGSGIVWGSAAWLFYPHGGTTERIGLLLTVYSFCVAGMPILAPMRKVYNTFALLCFAPTVLRVGLPGGFDDLVLAGVLLTIVAMTTLLASDYRLNYENLLKLKLRADELGAQLRIEKAAADAARQQAEVANRSKTQFFAAASHDLRQPLHAMGLFAEALRQRSHDEEVIHLVNSINGSVDALEGLFSELLDITKIDTGGVETQAEHFNIGALFGRLKLHFEPTAFEKGLGLRFRGGAHNAFADPVLVERILRNLVSNAIRYTQDGTVLVSCRKRGTRLLLQVWDTGVGIREREQERIFEEFYQVPQGDALAPHQRKGLGLGLAIVKRLAGLMEAPLSLRSRPGHGTVFSLELPPGKAPRAVAPALSGKAPIGLTLDRRRIVIVEDEPAVRDGLEVLLKGWGASVRSFETVSASRAWAQSDEAGNEPPDLLIVDYRLEHGHTGVEAIQALRERFGPGVPAIMVSGSTMTNHEVDAQVHNFHLLVKPVVPNKLRAMISFKLGVRGG